MSQRERCHDQNAFIRPTAYPFRHIDHAFADLLEVARVVVVVVKDHSRAHADTPALLALLRFLSSLPSAVIYPRSTSHRKVVCTCASFLPARSAILM